MHWFVWVVAWPLIFGGMGIVVYEGLYDYIVEICLNLGLSCLL